MAALNKFAKGFVEVAKPRWSLFLKYAKVELTPPKPTEMGQVVAGFRNLLGSVRSDRWKQVTVKEAWLNTLVATEIAMWFYVGEIIGRRHFVGYSYPRTVMGHH